MLRSFVDAMFTTLGLFKDVDCPDVLQCSMPKCMFSHRGRRNTKKRTFSASQGSLPPTQWQKPSDEENKIDQTPIPRKRIRITNHEEENSMKTIDPIVKSPNDLLVKSEPESNGGLFYGISSERILNKVLPGPSKHGTQNFSKKPVAYKPRLASTQSSEAKNSTLVSTEVNKLAKPTPKSYKETLNPRILPHPPASHAIRFKLISLLYEYTTKLNEEVRNSDNSSNHAILMSTQEIITEILDDEERVARDNPSIYTNILKRNISKLKNMKFPEWVDHRKSKITSAVKKTSDCVGLSLNEEIKFLKFLLNPEQDLVMYGYVVSAPTEKEVEQSRQGIEAAQGWENCERCKTRFQVFPGRREDGALSTGAPCRFHPSRFIRNSIHGCCDQAVGESGGCKSAASHVFKVSETKRLALILPFVETPPNPTLDSNIAVSLDCEMGFTSLGLELIRMTATMWPSGKELVDVLVQPQGEVMDLNSCYSGVQVEHFQDAIPYSRPSPTESTPIDSNLGPKTSDPFKMVDSPAEARSLLFTYISPSTPLIGHALYNDLNALRIIHPAVIDTAILYPHPRGLPARSGLKALVSHHLQRDIQMGGENGHDSKEDANAAGDLVRLRVNEYWMGLQKAGWTLHEGQFVDPADADADESSSKDRETKLNAEPETSKASLGTS